MQINEENKKEIQFKLQIIQHTISSFYAVPMRLYQNNAFDEILNYLKNNLFFKQARKLLNKKNSLSNRECKKIFEENSEEEALKKFINLIQTKLRERELDKEFFEMVNKILTKKDRTNKLNKIIWATRSSYSMPYIRKLKESKIIWQLLILDSILALNQLNEYEEIKKVKCFTNTNKFLIKINQNKTLVLGRVFIKSSNHNKNIDIDNSVKDIFEKFEIEFSDIFQLNHLAKQREVIDEERMEKIALEIKQCFNILSNIINNYKHILSRNDLEKIALFSIFIVKNVDKIEEISKLNLTLIDTPTLFVCFNIDNKKFEIKEQKSIYEKEQIDVHQYENFGKIFYRFKRNDKIRELEYISQIESTLERSEDMPENKTKYTNSSLKDKNINRDENTIFQILRRVVNTLNADFGCFIKYSISKNKLELISEISYGNSKYKSSILKNIYEINAGNYKQNSRALKIINRFYKENKQYDVNELYLFNESIDDLFPENLKVQSNIAMPIIYKNKLLGILIIDSLREKAFNKRNIQTIIGISNALAVHIYNEFFYNNKDKMTSIFAHSNSLIHDEKILKDKLKEVCEAITNILFCHGVAIWKKSFIDNDKRDFFKIATTILDDKRENCHLSENDNSVISYILKTKKEYIIENIDEYINFGKSDKPKLICNPKECDSRINVLIINPIFNDNKEVIGVLSIYNQKMQDFTFIDREIINYIISHLTMIFSILDTLAKERRLTESHALHDINQNIINIKNKCYQLKNILNENFKNLDKFYRYLFDTKIRDIGKYADFTKIGFDFIAGKSNQIKLFNKDDNVINDYINEIIKFSQDSNKSVNLREILKTIIKSDSTFLLENKHIDIDLVSIENKYYIKIPEVVLTKVFQNLFNNAVKYSFTNTIIKIISKLNEDGLIIYFENIGIKINMEEEYDIFEYGYRGFSAEYYEDEINGEKISYKRGYSTKYYNSDGEGKIISKKDNKSNIGAGLYICQKLTQGWGGGIELVKSEEIENNRYKNIFAVYLPQNKILLKENE